MANNPACDLCYVFRFDSMWKVNVARYSKCVFLCVMSHFLVSAKLKSPVSLFPASLGSMPSNNGAVTAPQP